MLKSDSRLVEKGDTFIAIKNVNTDGHDFIESAIEKGATKIICEHGNYPVETIIVPNTRKYLEDYLYNNFYPKFKDMKLIGVTGTNGKTTTCYLIYQMLNKLGIKCAYIGTIGFYYDEHKEELNNTTPDIDILYKMFIEAANAGCECMVMEVSSHALDMNRIHGLEFDEVAFTNLTQDHLDYHKTIENYANAKKKLFYKTRGNKIAVINGDDPLYKEFINRDNNNIIIGSNSNDVKIIKTNLTHLGSDITFSYNGMVYDVSINMVGLYNVYNYLTAVMLVHKLNISIDNILSIAKDIKAPSGRMELIKYNTNSIFIDYAHTPDAVVNVLKNANTYKKGKIITVIGCGGDRDRTKRPIMADETLKYSDYAIFTNDNPRTEDEKQIINDMTSHITSNNFEVIYDRAQAIKKAISMLKENDILMLLGKGHETYQIIGKEKIHFSDKEEVLKNIKK